MQRLLQPLNQSVTSGDGKQDTQKRETQKNDGDTSGIVLLLIVLVIGIAFWGLIRIYRYIKTHHISSLQKHVNGSQANASSSPKIDPENLQSLPGAKPDSPNKSAFQAEQLDSSGTYRADMSQFPDEHEPVIFLTLTRTVFDHYVKQKLFGPKFRDRFGIKL